MESVVASSALLENLVNASSVLTSNESTTIKPELKTNISVLHDDGTNATSDSFPNSSADNATDGAVKDTTSEQNVRVLMTILALSVILAHFISIAMLNKCKALPKHIILLSKNYLISEIFFHTINLTTTVATYVESNSNSGVTIEDSPTAGRAVLLSFNLMSMSAIAISLEKVIALKYGIYYTDFAKMKYTRWVLVFIYMYAIIVPTIIIGFLTLTMCNMDWKNCGLGVITDPLEYFTIVNMTLGILVSSIAYKIISNILQMQRKGIAHAMPFPCSPKLATNTNEPTLALLLVFNIMFIQCIAYISIRHIFGLEQRQLKMFIIFLCSVVNSCASVYIYTFKFRECRMMFLRTFLFWSERYKRKANEMRVVVYNIPISFQN